MIAYNNSIEFIEQLYITYSERIYRYLLTQGHPPEAAEDILQEVFLIALQKKDVLSLSPNKIGWLYKTAMYCSCRAWDKKQKDFRLNNKLTTAYQVTAPILQNQDGNTIFDDAKDILNENEWSYIQERFQQGKSNRQIAEEQNKSVSAITTYASRIYAKLRRWKEL